MFYVESIDSTVRDKPDGVRCPRCGCGDSKVIDSRGRVVNGWWRRRRECMKCGTRWTTTEVHEDEIDVEAMSVRVLADVPNEVLLAEVTRRFGWYVKEGDKK